MYSATNKLISVACKLVAGHQLLINSASGDLQSPIFLVDWCFYSETTSLNRASHYQPQIVLIIYINVTEILQQYCLNDGQYNVCILAKILLKKIRIDTEERGSSVTRKLCYSKMATVYY